MQLVTWGTDKELGNVTADRNRMVQLVVDEFTDTRIPLFGTKKDWWDYFVHWNNIYRVEVENSLGIKERKWERSGADHWVHATSYWRTGMSKFGFGKSAFFGNDETSFPEGYEIEPDQTVKMNPLKFIYSNKENDWRNVD